MPSKKQQVEPPDAQTTGLPSEPLRSANSSPQLRVLSVGPASLHLLYPLFEEFSQTPAAAELPGEALQQLFWQKIMDPTFLLLAVVEEDKPTEPQGFAASQLTLLLKAREVFVIWVYVRPGLSLEGLPSLVKGIKGWARAVKATRLSVNTERLHEGELAEENAWRRLGFTPGSILLHSPVD